jgi:hypothetical protein
MAVLGGVDRSNDELGCQEAPRIQKGLWEGVPPPEESHDTDFILNLRSTQQLNVSFGIS